MKFLSKISKLIFNKSSSSDTSKKNSTVDFGIRLLLFTVFIFAIVAFIGFIISKLTFIQSLLFLVVIVSIGILAISTDFIDLD